MIVVLSQRSSAIVDRITPRRVKYDPDNAFNFNLPLNILFGFSTTFTVSNLYYSQPNLNALALAFDEPNARIGHIPTLSQAGYAIGILLISPLGDLVKRRTLILLLVTCSTCVTIGLATVETLVGFEVLNFLIGLCTVTPQVLLPLVGDLAPPAKRASALSIVVSGLLLGILFARVVAGLCQSLTDDYRTIYYFAIAIQSLIFALLFWFLPDYPAKTGHGSGYVGIIKSTVGMMLKYPTLVQSCLISGLVSSGFLNFWVTSTFLLGGQPYNYTSLEIGLFGLLGIVGVCFAPFAGRLVDRMVPWYSMVFGISIILLGQLIGFASQFSLGGVIPQIFFMDLGVSSQQISNQSRIYALDSGARSRINSCYIIFLFLGQTMGSGVGTKLYTQYGWWASQSFAVACICAALLVAFARGPWQKENSWYGWSEGGSLSKRQTQAHDVVMTSKKPDQATNEANVAVERDHNEDTAENPQEAETDNDSTGKASRESKLAPV